MSLANIASPTSWPERPVPTLLYDSEADGIRVYIFFTNLSIFSSFLSECSGLMA